MHQNCVYSVFYSHVHVDFGSFLNFVCMCQQGCPPEIGNPVIDWFESYEVSNNVSEIITFSTNDINALSRVL